MSEPTIQFADFVFGETIAPDDPAESYHEASRFYPATVLAELPGLRALESDPRARASVERASRRHPHRERVALPRRPLPDVSLADAVARRVSRPAERACPLRLEALASILAAAYASRPTPAGPRRPVPSAGALYPLELYIVCAHVVGAPAGLLHYDPFDHCLARLRPEASIDEIAPALPDDEPIANAAAVLVVSAVFWRSRFKYGQRGYRFALLEAGHLAQNVLLACAAYEIAAVPLGGFFDRRLDAVVGANGADEAVLYALVLGGEGTAAA